MILQSLSALERQVAELSSQYLTTLRTDKSVLIPDATRRLSVTTWPWSITLAYD
jgi:hypothetical protein